MNFVSFFAKQNSDQVKIGSVCAKVVEPKGLTVNRICEILWKKQILDIALLARMRFEEKLGSRVISQQLGLPRTTVATAIRRLENKMA